MGFDKGKPSISLEDILNRVSESDILAFYLGVSIVPTIINSPLREDKKPSFGLYSLDGKKIYYIDYATNERGGLFDLLCNMWGISYKEVLRRINDDIPKFYREGSIKSYKSCTIRSTREYKSDTELQCKVREWKEYDIEYWNSYGISLEWLRYADVYPISHKIIIKNGHRYVFVADKYAYAYVEKKEGKITLKIYQPYNTKGYKWSNKHDASVISLWTKIPEYGEKLCICASLKDALCLSANLKIPAIAIQGEGYNISETAISELKRRYREVFILLDNDEAGLKDAEKLASLTKFNNIVLPKCGAKDISDLYKLKGKEEFIKIISPLFNSSRQDNSEWEDDLPFG